MSDRITCVVVGGGPAGIFMGLILARAGVEVTVLEKHGDFLRDFRGDTVHPTTMRLLSELGLWEEFEKLPQSKVTKMSFKDATGKPVTLIDFTRIRAKNRYIAMVPQWDLLDMLATAGRREPTFTLRMNTEATDVIRSATGVVTGVRYSSAEGEGSISADLVIACDGRRSTLRQAVGLVPREYPVDIDAWWCRVPSAGNIEPFLLPRFGSGRGVIAIPREGYFQVAYLSKKGTDAQLRARGIAAFRNGLAELLPEIADQLSELNSMDQVKFLDIRFNRLRTWHVPGLLCLGDSAHAMSPAGGIGINVAIQDAVAAAGLLAKPLLAGEVTERHLKAVRTRRLPAVIAAQTLQRVIHRTLIKPMIVGEMVGPSKPVLMLARRLPFLTAIPAFLVGIGLRPEHVPGFARR